MHVDTNRNFLTVILSVLLSVLAAPDSAKSQLKLELNFGDSDNFHTYLNTPSTRALKSPQLSENGIFDIGGLINPSPAGGNYLILNGINSFARLPADLDINLNGHISYSVSCWIYLYSTGVNGEIINADNGFVAGYRFYVENNSPRLEISEGLKEIFSTEAQIEPATWTHVGFFCDGAGDSVVLFLNGAPVANKKFERVTQANTGPLSYIGASIKSAQPNYLKANVDHLRFFAGRDSIFDDPTIRASKSNARKSRSLASPLFYLDQNYPNPFNLSTKIRFELRKSGYVELSIYDLLGNTVRVLEEAEKEEGSHEYYWDGTDTRGSTVTSGIYFVRLSYNGIIQTKKMILVK